MTGTAKPRGPYANSSIQRDRILRGALEYFGQYGYWGSSMRDIASHIGMSQASMRHYFGTKTELLTAVLEERDRVSGEALHRPGLDGEPRLDAIARLVADNASQPNIVRLFTMLSAEATTEDHPAHGFFADRYRRVTVEIADTLQKAIDEDEITKAVDVSMAARVTLSVMFGLQVQWLLDPEVDMPTLFADFLNGYFGPTGAATTERVASNASSARPVKKPKPG